MDLIRFSLGLILVLLYCDILKNRICDKVILCSKKVNICKVSKIIAIAAGYIKEVDPDTVPRYKRYTPYLA